MSCGFKSFMYCSALLFAVFGILLGASVPGVFAANEGKILVYYGLGDSVASGYGLPGERGECKISSRAYPVVAGAMLSSRLTGYDEILLRHFACSGTESDTLYQQIDETLRDLAEAREASTTDALVSMTVGADLFGWTELPEIRRIFCLPEEEFVKEIGAIVAGTNVNVQGQIARLLEHENVFVIVTDFYNPLNRTSKYLRWFRAPGPYGSKTCRNYSLKDLYNRSEHAIHTLNSALENAVNAFPSHRVRFARIHQAFHGHEGPWPQCGWSLPGPRKSWIQSAECFHPNVSGVDVIAGAIVAEALELTSRPVP
jgi:hypothetical protein